MRMQTVKSMLERDLSGQFPEKTKFFLVPEGTNQILSPIELRKCVGSFICHRKQYVKFDVVRLINVKIGIAKMGKDYQRTVNALSSDFIHQLRSSVVFFYQYYSKRGLKLTYNDKVITLDQRFSDLT